MSPENFNKNNDPNNLKRIELIDEESRSLPCYVEKELDVQDVHYLLVSPVDTSIRILALDGSEEETDDSELILIEDPEEIDEIFENAKAVLSELNLLLKNTAYSLTVEGEIPPFDEDQVISLELEEEDLDEEEPLEPEELQFLTSFYHGKYKYSIYTPLDPLLYIVKQTSNGKLELIDHEDPQLKPIIEAFLFEDQDDDN
ncbi:MAG: DUF3727 domain-containing protein [Cyanobacteriota bacterium ELA615]|jgi:hypothetical protein